MRYHFTDKERKQLAATFTILHDTREQENTHILSWLHKLRKQQEQKVYDQQRGTSTERGYDATWGKLRKMFLRENPLCNRCPGVVPATVVHHKIPIDRGGPRLEWSNLEALCAECHNRHHGYGKQ